MAFTNDDILKIAASTLAAGVIDSSGSQWYEKRNQWGIIVDPESIWSDLNQLRQLPAANFEQAVQNSIDNPDLIGRVGINDDGTFNDDTALRLTKVAGSNGTTYIAYNDYGIPTNGIKRNWLQPQLIPQNNGAASAAYGTTIFIGKPSLGKKLITSAGFDGNWVSHFWSPALGMLMIAPADKPPSATIPTDDLYICGFTYQGATGGAGGSFNGDTLLLDGDKGDWRLRVSEDGAYLKLERKDVNDNGTFKWNSYANIGASVTTDGLILTRPYGISFDLSNNLNTNELPDLRQVIALSGADQNVIIGNNKHVTAINTKSNSDIKRVHTLSTPKFITNRPLKDLEIILDRTSSPLPNSVKEVSWVSNINFSEGSISHIRFNAIAFDVTEVSDTVNGVPLRMAVETVNGELIQENVSIQGLDAGVKNGLTVNVGTAYNLVNPAYEERQNAVSKVRITVKRGQRVVLKAGEYEYVDPVDGLTKTQIIPWQQSEVEYFEYDSVLDTSNVQKELGLTHNVWLDNGISSWIRNPNTGEVQGPWSFASTGEHVDTRNPVIGNYYDKTYINAGEGGLWSLVEDKGTRTELWSTLDRERIFNSIEPSEFLELKEIVVPLNGIFAKEFEDLEKWNVVNLYNLMPLISWENNDPLITSNGYRVSIETDIGGFSLQQNLSSFDFSDGKIFNDHFITPFSNPSYTRIKLPRRTFAVNGTTARTIRIQFQHPVKVYGYYKNPADVNSPLPDEFVASIKGDVVRLIEEPIITGSALEDKLDGVIGEREWKEASEQGLDTLHIVPSLLALADKDGEWLIFGGTNTYADNDKHQWLFASGREAYYQPKNTDCSTVSGVWTAANMVVHIPRASDVNDFTVVLDPSAAFLSNSNTRCKFNIFVNTYGGANNFKFEITIPKATSVLYHFTKRRDGSYCYRATPFNDKLASTNPPNNPSLVIPVDPKPPIKI